MIVVIGRDSWSSLLVELARESLLVVETAG